MNPRLRLLPALLLFSCATAPETPIEPIEPIECLLVEYDAKFSTSSLPVLGGKGSGGEGDDTERDAPEFLGNYPEVTESTGHGEYVEVGCRMINLSRDRARQMLSHCDSRLGANRLPRAVAEEHFDTLAALTSVEEFNFPQLSLYHGQRGNLTIAHQRAYVDSFQVKVSPDGGTFLADPIVAVANEGLLVDLLVGGREGDAPMPIDLTPLAFAV